MTTEKIFEKVYDLARITLDADDLKTVEKVLKDPTIYGENYTRIPSIGFGLLLKELQAQIRTETAKTARRSSELAAANRLLKAAPEEWRGGWTGQDGRQYICNGYMMIALNSPLPMPEVNRPNLANLEKNLTGTRNLHAVETPDLAEIKANIKLEKARNPKDKEKRHGYDFGDGLPFVNACWLADILTVLGEDAKIGIAENSRGGSLVLSPVYFESDRGTAMLLPVRKAAGNAAA